MQYAHERFRILARHYDELSAGALALATYLLSYAGHPGGFKPVPRVIVAEMGCARVTYHRWRRKLEEVGLWDLLGLGDLVGSVAEVRKRRAVTRDVTAAVTGRVTTAVTQQIPSTATQNRTQEHRPTEQRSNSVRARGPATPVGRSAPAPVETEGLLVTLDAPAEAKAAMSARSTKRDRDHQAIADARAQHTSSQTRLDVDTAPVAPGASVARASSPARSTKRAEQPTAQTRAESPTRPDDVAPDNHGRAEVPRSERVEKLDAFVVAWGAEFGGLGSARASRSMMAIPSAWQERLLYVWAHWTREEIGAAFAETKRAAPRSAWAYFRKCLEAIAAGEWGKDKPESPGAEKQRRAEQVDLIKRLAPRWEIKPWLTVPLADVIAYARAMPGAQDEALTTKDLEQRIPGLVESGCLHERFWRDARFTKEDDHGR